VLGVVAWIVSLVYLLDCLFAERKDRSILFWKSLPVSDAETVLAKLGLALVVVPLLTLAMAVLCYCLMAGLLPLRYEHMRTAFDLAHVGRGLAALPQLANNWLFTVLWFAPGAAYLMLASVLAKRAPLAYAVLPPVVLFMIEQLLLDSNYVGGFLQGWIAPWASAIAQTDPENPFGRMGGPDWLTILQQPDLWLGLAATAVMVYMVIRLRRYRDDT
jgi:ABC-2 type transport system permease protein